MFCPQKRVIATGDMILGFVPNIGDGFPRSWPRTIDSVARLQFDKVLPGHGPLQADRRWMIDERNYLEELTAKVAAGKQAGKLIAELQKEITVNSLASMRLNGYAEYLAANHSRFLSDAEAAPLVANPVQGNVADVYRNLDRV